MDSHFAAFKRIIDISHCGYEAYIAENLELADKFWIQIDSLVIEQIHFNGLRKLYKDKDPNLMIECLYLDYDFESKGLIEDFEFINKISPKILTIKWNIWTIGNIRSVALLNWANVYLENNVAINEDIYFWFVNTPIQHFDSDSDQMLIFEWQSIKIFIEKSVYVYDDEINGIEEVKLLKTNTGSFLFIPLDTIHRIEFLEFKEILKTDDINKQFADLRLQHQFKEDGLIIPMGYSNRIFIKLEDNELDYLNQYKDIYKIFKEKQIEIKIGSLDTLLEINELIPDDFTRINFKYSDRHSVKIEEYSISEIMDDLDWSNLKFNEIFQSSTVLSDEFQFWWMMLSSRRTRFNVTSIDLKLSLLSECLTVLSLCLNCPELKSVKLKYEEEDIEYVDEVIENAQTQFRQEFGFIQELKIWEGYEE